MSVASETGKHIVRFVVFVVKHEVKELIKDAVHNLIEDHVVPVLRDWRFKLWQLAVKIVGRLYILPKLRKLIRYEKAAGMPHNNPFQTEGDDEDFRYKKAEPFTDYCYE